MKRFSLFVLLTLLLASPVLAQGRVPAIMVRFNTNGLTRFNTMTNLQDIINYLDPAPTGVNYAPRSTTNTAIGLVTPRWIGDIEVIYQTGGTNTQVWLSWSTSTSSWYMIYPVQDTITTNEIATNVAPFTAGQTIQVQGATNVIYRAFMWTNSTLYWKALYRGAGAP